MAAYQLHALIGEPGGLPAILALASYFLLPASVSLWVRTDAYSRGKRPPYDFDSLIFFLWPIAGPIYLFATRGWRGFAPIALFLVAYIGGVLFALLLSPRISISPRATHTSNQTMKLTATLTRFADAFLVSTFLPAQIGLSPSGRSLSYSR